VTGKKNTKYKKYKYIVTFDEDGINSRWSGYAPRELLVLDSNDNEILMTEEEYQKGKSVAKQRSGTKKLPEYERPFKYPKELTFVELENRVGTRVSYRGRKGSVAGTNNNTNMYIVTFDDDGNNTRECGYPPSELLVLNSNDNEIPMTKEEYQKGKSVARQRGKNKLPENIPNCEYPKKLTFIDPENCVGTRVSFFGRKGNVTGKKVKHLHKSNGNLLATEIHADGLNSEDAIQVGTRVWLFCLNELSCNVSKGSHDEATMYYWMDVKKDNARAVLAYMIGMTLEELNNTKVRIE